MRYLACIVILFVLTACRPPWQPQYARIRTLAPHKQDAYEFIKNYHDKRFQTDRLSLVLQATILEKQENDLGSYESWVIETENGNRFEYFIQIAIYWEGSDARGIYGQTGMAVLKFKQIPKSPT